MRAVYVKLMNTKLSRCYEPTEKCVAKAIRSHSIQNSRVLAQLSQNGHVIVPTLRIGKKGSPPLISFQMIGVNEATTFTGLCGKHDNLIFEPIDKKEFDTRNTQQLFLFAYRSVLKELYASTLGAYRVQGMYTERVKRGLSPKNQPDSHGLRATEHMINAYDTYLYKLKLDEIYLTGKFQNLINHIITFSHSAPTLAVSSVFSLDEIETPHDVARIILNIFPNNNLTHIIFSYLPLDAPYANSYLREIFSQEGKKQYILISKIVLESCENIVLAPSYFDSLSSEQQETIVGYFSETVFLRQKHRDLGDISLFNPK